MSGYIHDLKHALRSLGKKPGYAAAIILTMALGIGLTTAAFTAVDATLLMQFPYADIDRLVVPVSVRIADSGSRSAVTYADYRDWSEMRDVFEQVALCSDAQVDLAAGGEIETVDARRVTSEYFSVLGVRPELGRSFRPSDDAPGGPVFIILSHGLWQRRFASATDVIGRKVRVTGTPAEVIGVMPPAASYQTTAAAWLPVQADRAELGNQRRDNMVWGAIARLKSGVTLGQARARVKALAARLEREQPAVRRGWTNDLVPLRRAAIPESARLGILILFGSVLAVLLVACVNVAGLLLTEATRRQREIAVRMALGASRARLIRQLLTESLILALAGGACGLILARVCLDAIPSLLPAGVLPPDGIDLRVNRLVLSFTALVSCLSALTFGFLPAWAATSARTEESLRAGVGAVVQRRTHRARTALVAAELALSLVLLVSAGLLVRSFVRMHSADPGVKSDHVLTAGIRIPRQTYSTGARAAEFYKQAIEQIRTLHGVQAAAAVSLVPLGGPGFQLGRAFLAEGAPEPPAGPEQSAEWSVVTPSYFDVMRVPLVKGRPFNDRDTADSRLVTIISEAMAREMFPGRDPLGLRIRSWRDENALREIVGVASDVRYFGAAARWQPLVYVPHQQSPWRNMRLVVRTTGEPMALAPALRRVVRTLDPDVPLADVSTLEQYRQASMAGPRLAASMLGGFSAVALALAAIGVFGLMSYSVAQRRKEFGLRLALGAQSRDLVGLALRRGLAVTAAGIAIGAVGAWAISHVLAGLLFEVTPGDAATFVATTAILGATAVVASYVPARRATRVDPAITLRAE